MQSSHVHSAAKPSEEAAGTAMSDLKYRTPLRAQHSLATASPAAASASPSVADPNATVSIPCLIVDELGGEWRSFSFSSSVAERVGRQEDLGYESRGCG
jgi:hypothetical protein